MAVASVVVLPLPRRPGDDDEAVRLGQQRREPLAIARADADAAEIEQAVVLDEDAQDRRLAVHGRHDGDAKVRLRRADAHVGPPGPAAGGAPRYRAPRGS